VAWVTWLRKGRSPRSSPHSHRRWQATAPCEPVGWPQPGCEPSRGMDPPPRALWLEVMGDDGDTSSRSGWADEVSFLCSLRVQLARADCTLYSSMDEENLQEVRVNNLDEWLVLLGMKQKEFCDSIGIDGSTFRRWRARGLDPAQYNLSLDQARRLDSLLRDRLGLSIHQFPQADAKQIQSA
jgi:hypothetical protein